MSLLAQSGSTNYFALASGSPTAPERVETIHLSPGTTSITSTANSCYSSVVGTEPASTCASSNHVRLNVGTPASTVKVVIGKKGDGIFSVSAKASSTWRFRWCSTRVSGANCDPSHTGGRSMLVKSGQVLAINLAKRMCKTAASTSCATAYPAWRKGDKIRWTLETSSATAVVWGWGNNSSYRRVGFNIP